MSRRKLWASTAFVAAVLWVMASGDAFATFSVASLNGAYEITAAGFMHDEGTGSDGVGLVGGVNITGLVSLDGKGHVLPATDLLVSGGDSQSFNGSGFSCPRITTILASSHYTITDSTNGVGLLTLNFLAADACLPHGSLTFEFALSRSASGINQLVSEAFSDTAQNADCGFAAPPAIFFALIDQGTSTPGACVEGLVLNGELLLQ